MAYSSSSAAYDLSAYDVPQKKQRPELKAVKTSRRIASVAFTPQMLSSFVIVVTLICLMVYNQVQLNEVTGEINSINAQLQKLESENIKLNSELESAVNLRTIGEQAKTELGMHRLDKHQIEYINLQREDKIVLTEASPSVSLGQKIKMAVTSAIGTLQEYIGDR